MRRKVLSLLIIIAGLFLVIAPLTFLQPCMAMEGTPTCQFLAKTAELIGIIIAVLGIGGLVVSDKKSTVVIGIVTIVTGVIEAITPIYIGACEMHEMACRMKTVPGIYIASIAAVVFAIVLVVTELLSGRSGEDVR